MERETLSENEDDRQQKQGKSRRKSQRAKTAHASTDVSAFTDVFNYRQYANLILKRLEKAAFIPVEGSPIVAKQTRHVNNYQHSISFRQQFVEQIAADIEYMDRKIQAHYQKQAISQDRQHAVVLAQLEKVYAKKEREMELLNHRDTVEKLLKDHLKNSTPDGQLRRIAQLEEQLEVLREEYNALNERVQMNEKECCRTKDEHHQRIENLSSTLTEFRIELDRYKQIIMEKIDVFQDRLKLADEKQNQNEILMKKLQDEIEQFIKDRHQDEKKMNQLAAHLESLYKSFNETEKKMILIDQIPMMLEELKQFRSLLSAMETRLEQTESVVTQHEQQFKQIAATLTSINDLLNQLTNRTDRIENEYIPEITNLRQNVGAALDKINQLHRSIDNNFMIFGNKFREIDLKLSELNARPHDLSHIVQRLENLEENMRNLSVPPESMDFEGLRDFFRESVQSIGDLLNETRKEFGEKINETKSSLDEIKKCLSNLFSSTSQKSSDQPPPIIERKIRTKKSLFQEPLKSMDLFEQVWD